MKDQDTLRLSWLGLHPDRLRQLREQYGQPADVLAAMRRGEIQISDKLKSRMETPIAEIRATLKRADASIVEKNEFPDALRQLPDAPDLLYVRGVVPNGPLVAVVGTRRSTSYGRRIARSIGVALAQSGWPVVSGLARGIDAAAHHGSLDGSGTTVAVLGSGIDVIYPPEHRSLAERVAAGGALVTEAPPGARPSAWRFPPRNRIISGLAAAVVVVEAKTKGGALITAARGLEQGRPVFAVPGDIDRETSMGCNLLIRDGAHPVLGVDDLIEGLSFLLGAPVRPEADRHPLLEHLEIGIHVEQLTARVGWPISRVLQELGKLEADGRVVLDGQIVFARDREKPA